MSESLGDHRKILNWLKPFIGTPAKVALRAVQNSYRWASTVLGAVIAPEELRAAKKVTVIESVITIVDKVEKSRQQNLEWRIKQYKSLGLKPEDIRARVLSELDHPAPHWQSVKQIIKEEDLIGPNVILGPSNKQLHVEIASASSKNQSP